MTRFRITVHGHGLELRGYVDEQRNLASLAQALNPLGLMVVASEADADYDPFRIEGKHVGYDGYIPGPLDVLVQKRIAGEIEHDEMMSVIEAYKLTQESSTIWDLVGMVLQTPPDGLSGEEYRQQVIALLQGTPAP